MADLLKKTDGTDLPTIVIPLDAEVDYTIFWAAEEAANQGALAKFVRRATKADRIDLDAALMLANAAKAVVGAAHPLNKNALFGSAIYQQNNVATEGTVAEETIKIFFRNMHADVDWATLAATCFGSLTGLANLAMLGFKLVDANTGVTYLNAVRSIEDDASAAIFGRLARTPQGWLLTQTDDTVTIDQTIRDEKAKWRSLTTAMREALR